MIEQIKEALDKAPDVLFKVTGRKWARYLLDELEKAQKENVHQENRYQTMFREILPVAQQRDRYYAELEILRTEHSAMKETLEMVLNIINDKEIETYARKHLMEAMAK